MGGPTSANVSEIYMQSLETTAITTADHPSKVWECHVDDVFSIVHKAYLQEILLSSTEVPSFPKRSKMVEHLFIIARAVEAGQKKERKPLPE